MSIIIPANSAVGGGFEVANSVRMNRGSSDYFRRTNNTAGTSDKIGTYSGWVKRSTTTLDGMFFEGKDLAASNYTQIYFQATGALTIYGSGGGMDLVTTALFRDPNAWYHVVVAFDTTQGTSTNRVKVYVNGVQQTSFATSTYLGQNATIYFGINGDQQGIGVREDGALLWNGYMSEICYVDGQALAPTEFGEFDEDSGVWKPIDVSGLTFGNNGCYLDFQDASNLGNVVAGNSTDFTENGLTAIDQATDTCTNNFATLNPLDNFYNASTFSEGNLKLSTTTTPEAYNSSTIAVSSGKWYCEIEYDTTASGSSVIGIVDGPPTAANASLHKQAQGWGYRDGGNVKNNDSTVSGSWASYTTGDIIGIALDLDNNRLFFSKNGSFQNSGDPTSSTGAITITAPSSLTTGHYFFAIGDYNAGTSTFIANFGNPIITGTDQTDGNDRGSFEYAVPSGYLALCTKNLSGELS